jgi:hypothetical protein
MTFLPQFNEKAVLDFYSNNLIVALPLTILFIKLLVRYFTREPAKDIFKSLLVLPLDLIYVAFGLLLAGIAGRIPAFAAHYETVREADFAGFAGGCWLFAAACFVTWSDRGLRLLWQKFFAAWSLTRKTDNPDQMTLPTQQINIPVLVIAWMFIYWSLMIPIVLFELALSVASLSAILTRLE